MLDKLKNLMVHFMDITVAALVGLIIIFYGVISAAMLTRVINEFRLDTYLGVETGLSIVLLLVMMVYIPACLMIGLVKKR